MSYFQQSHSTSTLEEHSENIMDTDENSPRSFANGNSDKITGYRRSVHATDADCCYDADLDCDGDSGNETSDDDDDFDNNRDSDYGAYNIDYDADESDDERAPFLNIHNPVVANVPLISKREVKIKDHLLAITAISCRHHLTYEATLDTLRWMKRSHEVSGLPTTKAALWKALGRDCTVISVYYYCHNCNGYLGKKSERTGQLENECPCGSCGPEKSENHLRHFLYLNLTKQIELLFKVPKIKQLLQYRFTREKKDVDAIEDVYDGVEYRALCSPGQILEKWHN